MADAGEPSLLERMRAEIAADGPLSFARFMDLALHDPLAGYYASSAARIGRAGDFFTASDVGSGFGRSIARQLAELLPLLPANEPFDVVEFGSGRGLLARDILDAAPRLDPQFARRLHYTMVDRSAAMRAESARNAPAARSIPPDDLSAPWCGCALAVELFDALGVHRLRRRDGRLVEIGVGVDAEGALVETEIDVHPEARALAERYGAATQEGSEAEVAPEASRLLAQIVATLRRGLVLIVDYGDRARRLYGPERPRGTLLAYRDHVTHEAFLRDVGRQDLTAHVNFSQLEDAALELGLTPLAFTTQDRFLVANGILEDFEQPDLAAAYDPRRVKQRLQAMQLIHPTGMGRIFKVLVLAKGFATPPHLAGLSDPFARF